MRRTIGWTGERVVAPKKRVMVETGGCAAAGAEDEAEGGARVAPEPEPAAPGCAVPDELIRRCGEWAAKEGRRVRRPEWLGEWAAGPAPRTDGRGGAGGVDGVGMHHQRQLGLARSYTSLVLVRKVLL